MLALPLLFSSYVSMPLIALVIKILSLFWHLKLGLQVVIEDYIHGEGRKLALILLVRFVAVLSGLAAVVAILRIGFGG